MSDTQQKRISFLYQPYEIENGLHVVEKDDAGLKRRYLRGIASGPAIDGHGERITEKCLKSIMAQANAGDILLYADKHGVAYSDDIGILTGSELTPQGDWLVEFRLYDAKDGVGQNTLETVDKLWKQINGFPPYKAPKQRGFSIEGFIPDSGILHLSADGRRVIDDVILDGVVVVPRPAYKTSIAHSVYKALEERAPWQINKDIENTFRAAIASEEIQNAYYRKRYTIQDKLEEQIESIMHSDMTTKEEFLLRLFDEYRDVMVPMILSSESIFTTTASTGTNSDAEDEVRDLYKQNKPSTTVMVLKDMISNIDLMIHKLQ